MACSASGVGERASMMLVERIKSTMSDCRRVEKAFNTIFDNFQSSLLPASLVHEDWVQLPAGMGDIVPTVHHFYFGSLCLIGLAG